MNHPNSFPKQEHLCGDKRISRLFAEGEAFIAYPLRVVFRTEPLAGNVPASVLVSVPKKRFKRAVKRNRLKRLMREGYRLNKQELAALLKDKGLHMDISFTYIADEVLEFAQIEKKMKAALQKLMATINS